MQVPEWGTRAWAWLPGAHGIQVHVALRTGHHSKQVTVITQVVLSATLCSEDHRGPRLSVGGPEAQRFE